MGVVLTNCNIRICPHCGASWLGYLGAGGRHFVCQICHTQAGNFRFGIRMHRFMVRWCERTWYWALWRRQRQ